ncbi:hypothetical protein [Verminephrobacter aporrectodeae]|uniref:hypothetical protein n=1 Tax=Verminephrobacter aporrectodeae TaxID=1110389 RepID=UPI002236F02A|nr:hypothetical protein [Verminephrobacter aporrectodeae]
MKLRLSRHGGVANPRDTSGYRCGLRLAMTRNASVSFCAAIRRAEHYRADLSAGRLAQRRFRNALFGPDMMVKNLDH